MTELADIDGVVLVGAGNMGGAMLSGWVAGGLRREAITVIDPNPSNGIKNLLDSRGIRHAVAASDAIKAKMEALQAASMKLGEALYAQSQGEAEGGSEEGSGQQESSSSDDDVVDADFEEDDDDKKDK